jgi:hypothetical protein
MVVTVVAARTNRVSAALPVIVSDYLIGYSLSGDGQRPLCHWDLLYDAMAGTLQYHEAVVRQIIPNWLVCP